MASLFSTTVFVEVEEKPAIFDEAVPMEGGVMASATGTANAINLVQAKIRPRVPMPSYRPKLEFTEGK